MFSKIFCFGHIFSRNMSRAYFDAATKYPMNLVEERFKRLNMDAQTVEVITYPVGNNLKVLSDTHVEFDPYFDPNIRSKSQISKMPQILELLVRPENCRLSDYALQYRLCKKEGYNICVRIGRRIINPDIDLGVYNIREEVLRWIEFTVNNTMEKDHFLTPMEIITYIGSNNTSLDKILETITDSRRNAKEIMCLTE